MKFLTSDNSNNKLCHVNSLGTPNGKENKLIDIFLNYLMCSDDIEYWSVRKVDEKKLEIS